MSRQLFVCNSVYQILISLWIKYTYHNDQHSDLIISDHMNDGNKIVEKVKETGLFENVYYVENQNFAKFKVRLNRIQRIRASLNPNQTLDKFLKLDGKYEELFVANVDYFSQLLFDALAHRNRDIHLTIYEDGLFTYSKVYEKDYESTYIPIENKIKQFIHSVIYRKKTIYGNVTRIMVFNPDNMRWTPEFTVEKMKKIQKNDKRFRDICNTVFSYLENMDIYDKKYIFMEESFYAEGAVLNDVEVLEKLAERVGRENIMIKIHPRNSVNRFKELGYKTNINTSIPWEVILMNLDDISDKVLLTVSSSSILNPILIFGQKIQAFSIYECVDHEHCHSRLLTGEMWETAKALFEKYSDMVKICKSVDEIV